ncbi:MAG: peptide chain release factor N(5)-glutamine methyltransferase [Candidatus Brocadiia bacterium]
MTESPEVWTVLRVLQWSEGFLARKGIQSPRTEVDLLLAESLKARRLDLYVKFERVLSKEQLAGFRELLLRRAAREPSAYILGRREFYGMPFKVDRRALIPRPETEHLVDAVLDETRETDAPRILDVGTGCGCIAAALATKRKEAHLTATDISEDALSLARENFAALGLSGRIRAIRSDLFSGLSASLKGTFDGVASNPPYVAEADRPSLQPEVISYEPLGALFGGADGLDVIRRLVAESKEWLKPNGLLAFEIGAGQAADVGALLKSGGFERVSFRKDYAGIERVACAR